MTGDTDIHAGNMRFDDLCDRPELAEIGDHADLAFEQGKGLFVQEGFGKNFLHDLYIRFMRLFENAEERRAAFADAVNQVKVSIDNQYGYAGPNADHCRVMEGDLTLGEYIVRSLTDDHTGEYRLNGADLKQVQRLLMQQIAEGKIQRRPLNPDAPTCVGDSRHVQSQASAARGLALMAEAVEADVYADAAKHSVSTTFNDHEQEAIDEVLDAISRPQGLSLSNLEAVRSKMESLGYKIHPKLDRLYEVTDLRRSIDVSRQHCIQLNKAMQDTINALPLAMADRANDIVDARRAAIERLQSLPYPDGLRDRNAMTESYGQLLENACELLDLIDDLEMETAELYIEEEREKEHSKIAKEKAIELLKQQAIETMGLAASLRPRDGVGALLEPTAVLEGANLVQIIDRSQLFTVGHMRRQQDALARAFVSPPATLYRSKNPTRTQLPGTLAESANLALEQVHDQLEETSYKLHDGRNRQSLAEWLVTASALVDRRIELAERRQLIGGRKDAAAVSSELEMLNEQRTSLNLLKLNLLFAPDIRRGAPAAETTAAPSTSGWMQEDEYGISQAELDELNLFNDSEDEENASLRSSRVSNWQDRTSFANIGGVSGAPDTSLDTSDDDLNYRFEEESDFGQQPGTGSKDRRDLSKLLRADPAEFFRN